MAIECRRLADWARLNAGKLRIDGMESKCLGV